MTSALRKIFGFIGGRPWLMLAAIVLLAALSTWGAAQTRLDGDLSRLLPESAPSVAGLERLQREYGDEIGRVTVVLNAPDRTTGRQAAERLATTLEDIEGVDRAEATDPASHLEDLRLLYIETPDLQAVAERVRKRIRWEKSRANPLFADLGGDPPDVDLSDIEEKYRGEFPDRTYYEGDDGEILVFVRPDFPPSDLDATKSLVDVVRERTDRFIEREFPETTFALTGRYVKRIEQQRIMAEDIRNATTLALVLLAFFLLAYFRSFVSAGQVILPLMLGTVSTIALTHLYFGSFNILTGFLGAILLGLGVDYGIHLVSRFHDIRHDRSTLEALVETFRTSGRANFYAGLTTTAALGSLIVSDFRAFFEFGIIAVTGITSILIAYALVLPTLVFLRTRFGGDSRVSMASIVSRKFATWQEGVATEKRLRRRRITGWMGAGVVMLFLIIGATGASHVDLDESFDSLTITGEPAWRLDKRVNEILGESQTPAVVLVEGSTHEQRVIETLRKRQSEEPGLITRILARGDIVPGEQATKIDLLRDLKEQIEEIPEGKRSEKVGSFLDEIETVLEAAPVEFETLPRPLRKPFSRAEGFDGSVVLVMPGVDLAKAEPSRRFADALRGLPGPTADAEETDGISESILMADIIDYVTRDIVWMVGVTAVGLLLVTLLAFGFRRDVWILVGTLIVSIWGALGVMGLAGVDFNFMNLVIIPIWLGLGVDASYHLLIHIRENPGEIAPHVTTALSVAAAFLTSMIGFGSLWVAHHAGMRSLAAAAVLGLSAVLLVNLGMAAFLVARERPSHPEVAE